MALLIILALRPALLLWRLTTARADRADRFRDPPLFSPASTNDLANATPYAMLSEQPDHWKLAALLRARRAGERVVMDRSQPQRSSCPELHARVTAYTTPADEIAWTNAASRVPVIITRRIINVDLLYPFDVHCCYMGTAIKHPVSSFVIFDIRALWRSGLSVRMPRYQKLQKTA